LAIPIEFANVIVQKPAVERSFPGGLGGFARQDLSNLCEDDHLLRVSFMSTAEAFRFISELEAMGLRFRDLEAASDIALVQGLDDAVPPWLSIGRVDDHAACWASGNPAGELASPEPGLFLRCPRPVYDSLAEVVGRCGAQLQEASTDAEEGVLARLRCVRGEAELLLDVIGDREGDSPVGLCGWRQLARRIQFRADVALIRDLAAVLKRAGATDL
jgi:hypothetical protein